MDFQNKKIAKVNRYIELCNPFSRIIIILSLELENSFLRIKQSVYLDYGCILYGSARTSYLKALDAIHHQGLRLCLGTFLTSSANKPPLYLRRLKFTLQYITKLKANIYNAFYWVFHKQFESLYDKNKKNY